MLTASAYANKEKLTEATTFIEEHWLDIYDKAAHLPREGWS